MLKSNKPSFSKPPYQSNFKDRIYINPLKVDESDIIQLFAIVSDCDISKIQEHRLKEGIQLDIVNSDGNTLIHHVLLNSNDDVNESQKKDMIEFLFYNSVPLDKANNKGITPLLIACKQKLTKLVYFLLENGCNPNTYDMKGMNCFHYAILSKVVACKKKPKIPYIIPETINEKKPLQEINDIAIGIVKFLRTHSYIKHIKASIDNFDTIYKDEIDRQKIIQSSKVITFIENASDITKEPNDTESLIASGELLAEIITRKWLVTKPMDISRGHKTGWKPRGIKEPILEFVDKDRMKNHYYNIALNDLENAINGISDTQIFVQKNIANITTGLELLNSGICDVYQLNIYLKQNNQNSFDDYDFIIDTIFFKRTSEKIYTFDIGEKTQNIIVTNSYKKSSLDIQQNRETKITRLTEQEKKEAKKNISPVRLTNDGNNTWFGIGFHEKLPKEFSNANTIDITDLKNKIISQFLITFELLVYIERTVAHYEKIKLNIDLMKKYSKDRKYIRLYYPIMIAIYLSCLSVCTNLLFVNKFANNVKKVLETLNIKVQQIYERVPLSENYRFVWYNIKEISVKMGSSLQQIITSINSLYANIVSFIENMNAIIDSLNGEMATEYVFQFYSERNVIPRDYSETSIKKFHIIPITFTEFDKLYGKVDPNLKTLITEVQKDIIEKYFPKIDYKLTFHVTDSTITYYNPNLGTEFNNEHNSSKYELQITKQRDGHLDLTGQLGTPTINKKQYTIQKEKSIDEIVKNKLDQHLTIAKFSLIQEFLNRDINQFNLSTGATDLTTKYIIIGKLVDEIIRTYLISSIKIKCMNIFHKKEKDSNINLMPFRFALFSIMFDERNSDLQKIVKNQNNKKATELEFIGDNYNNLTPQLEPQCIKYDEELFQILKKYGCDINKKDLSGCSPIFHAISLKNPHIVNILKRLNCDYKTIQNLIFLTPIEYAKKIYELNFKRLILTDNQFEFITKFNKRLEKQLSNYELGFLDNFDLTYKMLILLFNYYFKTRMDFYELPDWNNNDMNSFNTSTPFLPDLEQDDISLKSEYIQEDVSRLEKESIAELDELRRRLLLIKDKPKRVIIENRIRELENPGTLEKLGQDSQEEVYETDEFKKFVFEASNDEPEYYPQNPFEEGEEDEEDEEGEEEEGEEGENEEEEEDKEGGALHSFPQSGGTITKLDDTMLKEYNDTFKKNPDLYYKKWETCKINKNMPHLYLINNNNRSTNAYTKIFIPTIENLTGNYSFIKENIELKNVINIFEHIVKVIICNSLYNTIKHLLEKYASKRDTKDMFKDTIKELKEIILEKIPLRAVKFYLKIYNNVIDKDRNYNTIDEITKDITNTIMLVKTDMLTYDSFLIKAVTNNILPIYHDLMKLIILDMQILLVNYCNFIKNDYNMLQILNMLE